MNCIDWTHSLRRWFPSPCSRWVPSTVALPSLQLTHLRFIKFANASGTSFTLSFCFHSLTLQFVLFKHSYRVLSANHLPPSIRSNLHSVTFVYSFQFKLHYFRLIIITVRLLANNIKLMFHYPKGIVSNYCYNNILKILYVFRNKIICCWIQFLPFPQALIPPVWMFWRNEKLGGNNKKWRLHWFLVWWIDLFWFISGNESKINQWIQTNQNQSQPLD